MKKNTILIFVYMYTHDGSVHNILKFKPTQEVYF